MSDRTRTKQDGLLSIRLPEQLSKDLQTLATQEANPPSAVARRFISAGVNRALRTKAAKNDRDRDW